MLFKGGASFQGLRVPACCSSFSSAGHFTSCWLCTVGSWAMVLSLQTPMGTSGNCWGHRFPFSSLWGPLTTVAHLCDVKTIQCESDAIMNLPRSNNCEDSSEFKKPRVSSLPQLTFSECRAASCSTPWSLGFCVNGLGDMLCISYCSSLPSPTRL